MTESGAHLGAALELLDELGPADPGLGVGIGAMAAGAGVTRSTLYRWWPSTVDMNTDLAVYGACCHEGWQRRLLASAPDGDLGAGVAAALGHPRHETAAVVRGVASGWRAGPARSAIAGWEAGWLDLAATWIDRHARARGLTYVEGASPRLVALVVTALVEGHVLLVGQSDGQSMASWTADDSDLLAARIERLAGEVFVEGGAPEEGPSPLVDVEGALGALEPDIDQGHRRLLARYAASYDERPEDPDLVPTPRRLVDLGRLSRRLHVSERRLYAVWPTASDMNAALAAALIDRQMEIADDLVAEAVAVGLADQYGTFDLLLSSLLDAQVRAGAPGARATLLTASLTAQDPAVRAALAEPLDRWRGWVRTSYLAVLAMSGAARRADVSPSEYADTLMRGIAGLQRLAGLHPALLDETATYRGRTHSAVGIGALFLGRSLTLGDSAWPQHVGHDTAAPTVTPPPT